VAFQCKTKTGLHQAGALGRGAGATGCALRSPRPMICANGLHAICLVEVGWCGEKQQPPW